VPNEAPPPAPALLFLEAPPTAAPELTAPMPSDAPTVTAEGILLSTKHAAVRVLQRT